MTVFETELIGIDGVPKPESIIEKAKDKASSTASSAGEEATEGVKEAIVSKVGEAAEALKVTLADTDGDGQVTFTRTDTNGSALIQILGAQRAVSYDVWKWD